MSLIACQFCGKLIADNADVCPGCGGKISESYRQMMTARVKVVKYIAFGFIGLLAVFFIAACLFGKASDEELKRRREQQEHEDVQKNWERFKRENPN